MDCAAIDRDHWLIVEREQMGNRVPYSPELAARIIELYRQRVSVRLIVELTQCSVAQAKRAIRESPSASDDHAARIRVAISKTRVGDRSQHGPDW